MRILTIGSDRKLFVEGSAVLKRARAYAVCLGELHTIVFSLKRMKLKEVDASEQLHLYPTNSWSRLLYILDAFLIGRTFARIDVVSVQDPFESGLAGLLVAKALGVPLHVQVHTDIGSPHFRRGIKNRIRLVIARRVLRVAAHIRVVSHKIREDIERIYHPRADIAVLPIFVDTARFAHATVPERLAQRFTSFTHVFLVVSRLEREKNVMRALEAFAQTASDNCLVILGEGSEKKRLQERAKILKIEKRVFFEGTQDPAAYYPLADLVLSTSNYEGYSMVIIEALAAGTPVLSTDVGVAREAGAIVADSDYAQALLTWIESGPREGKLAGYPYTSEEHYVEAYCRDIREST